MKNSRKVSDGKGRILVEVLRLDEALEQVPAHGGWRAGRVVVWCAAAVGMGIWRLLRRADGDGDDATPRQLDVSCGLLTLRRCEGSHLVRY